MYTTANGDFVIEVTNGNLAARGNGTVGIVLHPESFDIYPTGAHGFVVRFRRGTPAGDRMFEQYRADGVYIDLHGAVYAWTDPIGFITNALQGGADVKIESVEDGGSEVRDGTASGGG